LGAWGNFGTSTAATTKPINTNVSTTKFFIADLLVDLWVAILSSAAALARGECS
jgi:hypothetical protein